MRLLNNPFPIILAAFALLAVSATPWEPEEDVVGRLHRLHMNPQSSNAAVIDAATEAISKVPPGPYRAGAQTILAWRLLKADKKSEAKTVYESMAANNATPGAFVELARRWLTRLDREEVRKSLQQAWIEEIRFPDTLATLPKPTPPLKDRWGQAWRYRTGSMRKVKSEGQRYELQSLTLGSDSDLATALARPWPEEPSLKPQRTAQGIGPTMIAFNTTNTPPELVTLTEGKSGGGITLVKIGPKALLIVEADYLHLPLKPGF